MNQFYIKDFSNKKTMNNKNKLHKANVIAEIGINHKGSIKIAKTLIKAAKDSGCWGVKFQYRDINNGKNIQND